MRKAKQTGQKEIGRIKLSDTQDLVVSSVDAEKLDLRVFGHAINWGVYPNWFGYEPVV